MTTSRSHTAWLAAALLALCGAATAQTPPTLLQKVRIFDGKGAGLSAPSHVLVRGEVIERISATPITPPAGATVIDGQGRTLMPGLIDNHWHTMFAAPSMGVLVQGKLGVVEEGALADLLLVDGDPLDDLQLIATPDKSFVLVMKGGTIHKNMVLR